jgi:hypothetical protein
MTLLIYDHAPCWINCLPSFFPFGDLDKNIYLYSNLVYMMAFTRSLIYRTNKVEGNHFFNKVIYSF